MRKPHSNTWSLHDVLVCILAPRAVFYVLTQARAVAAVQKQKLLAMGGDIVRIILEPQEWC